MSKDLSIIILTAGKGTRMKSELPKSLHKIAGISMLDLVIKNAKSLNPRNITILISPEMEKFSNQIKQNHLDCSLNFVIQKERLGTGNAAKIALEKADIEISNQLLILYGDTPLIKDSTLNSMIDSLDAKNLCVLGFECNEENSYGRLIAKDQDLLKITEYKDANNFEKQIKLCNSGVIALKHKNILSLINEIDNNNAANEYYLTDIVQIIIKHNLKAGFIKTDQKEVIGVNSRSELARAEAIMQDNLREKLMSQGVTLIDPKTNYFAYDIEIENDVIIHPNVVIGKEVQIKSGVEIKSFSHIEESVIENNSVIGPFARIRPGSKIGKNAKIGNFVEIKKSIIKEDVKISHLSYIGDSEVGKNSNIGAGTITCNYDGYNKFQTKIGDDVFIGSNSSLIAPVKISNNTVIGAGSVISKNILEGELSVSRPKQINIKNGAISYHKSRKK